MEAPIKGLEQLMAENLAQTADDDQFHTQALAVARTLVEYRRTFMDGGVPQDLAEAMMAKLHDMRWSKTIWPDSNISLCPGQQDEE